MLSGAYALACIPAVFIFEHYRWDDAPLHITALLASIICLVSAVMYLRSDRAPDNEGVESSDGTPVPDQARRQPGGVTSEAVTVDGDGLWRPLAYVAIALAGGFLLLCAIVVVLLANSMEGL